MDSLVGEAINSYPAQGISKAGVVNSHFSHLSCLIFLHNFTLYGVSPDPLSLREGLARETN